MTGKATSDLSNIDVQPELAENPPGQIKEVSNNVDSHTLAWQKEERYSQDTKHRSGLILWVKWVVSLWLGANLAVLLLNRPWVEPLHDGVLIALLTTTTANILGLAYIILDGLFKDNRSL